jgi:hypothetical protein
MGRKGRFPQSAQWAGEVQYLQFDLAASGMTPQSMRAASLLRMEPTVGVYKT